MRRTRRPPATLGASGVSVARLAHLRVVQYSRVGMRSSYSGVFSQYLNYIIFNVYLVAGYTVEHGWQLAVLAPAEPRGRAAGQRAHQQRLARLVRVSVPVAPKGCYGTVTWST